MATDVQAQRRDGRPHKTSPGALALARTEILKNKWVQGALIASCFFLIYFATGNMSNPYDQYVRRVIRKVLLFGGGLGAMASLVLLYNYARFHTIFDGGYGHPQYESLWAGRGLFNISHITTHIDGIFYLGPELNAGQFPFFKPSVFGMALFMVTPAFLYAYGALAKRLEGAAAVAMGLVMIPHVLYVVTGGGFGYRFSMDYIPMLMVLTASGMGHRIGTRQWLLIGLSVFMAMWGPLFFFDTRLEDWLEYQWKQ